MEKHSSRSRMMTFVRGHPSDSDIANIPAAGMFAEQQGSGAPVIIFHKKAYC